MTSGKELVPLTFFIQASEVRSLILSVHEPNRALWFGPWKKLKRILLCRGEPRVSSHSASFVSADWIRPGVAWSRLPPIYRLCAVSSCPMASCPAAFSCLRHWSLRYFLWFLSVTYQLAGRRPLRIHRTEKIRERSRNPPPFWEFYGSPSAKGWSRIVLSRTEQSPRWHGNFASTMFTRTSGTWPLFNMIFHESTVELSTVGSIFSLQLLQMNVYEFRNFLPTLVCC